MKIVFDLHKTLFRFFLIFILVILASHHLQNHWLWQIYPSSTDFTYETNIPSSANHVGKCSWHECQIGATDDVFASLCVCWRVGVRERARERERERKTERNSQLSRCHDYHASHDALRCWPLRIPGQLGESLFFHCCNFLLFSFIIVHCYRLIFDWV